VDWFAVSALMVLDANAARHLDRRELDKVADLGRVTDDLGKRSLASNRDFRTVVRI
jgi:hypothetical protein